MKKHSVVFRISIGLLFLFLTTLGAVSCNDTSSGGGGSSDPSGGIVDPSGNTVTEVDTNDPVNLSLSNLTANSQYTILVTSPDGEALNPDGGFVATTDEDGDVGTSTIIQDLSLTESTPSSLVKGLVLWSDGFSPRYSTGTGSYEVSVQDENGEEILATSFTVSNSAKVYCSQADGTGRASFTPSDSVYATISEGDGTVADGTYSCYTFSDQNALLADGDTLAGTATSVTVASGTGTASLGTFSSGIYDVVCDMNANGTYDEDTDLLARPGRFRPCFTIQSANSGNDIIGQICSDRQGNYRDIFDPNATNTDIRDVWAWISPSEQSLVQHSIGVCKYVVDHQSDWTSGDTLTDVDASIEVDPVQGFCTNEAPWLVWPRQNLTAGCYDCIIDVNCNGVYDKGTDFVDNIDNTGDNTVGGMCVANSSACTNYLTISSHTDGQTVETTAITLTGELEAAGASGKVIVTSGNSSNTVTFDVSSTTFSANLPLFNGENQITVSITKADGTICSKTISVTSTTTSSTDQLFRAQLTWDGDTDMDLHLVSPSGDYSNGGGGTTDCNYGNCDVGMDGASTNSIDWGTTGSETDDPKLDVDCIACGTGIENIWMNAITDNGAYRVYVDAYNGTETNVQVTIFIKGATVATVNCGSMSSGTATDSCYVGDITWTGGSSGNGNFTTVNTLAADY